MPPDAHEVRVANTRARLGVVDNHPRTAVSTVETALEKMRVFTGALPIDMGGQHILDLLPSLIADECRMYPRILNSLEGQNTCVIAVRQHFI